MVQITPGAAPQAAPPSPWDILDGSGKSISFAVKNEYGQTVDLPVGTSFNGIVREAPETMQQTDFDTGDPKFYKDGRPMWMLRVSCDTNLREDPEDDGVRTFYLRGQALQALRDEMKRHGLKQFGVGTQITQTHIDYKPSGKGNPQKIYKIDLVPATSNPAVDAILAGGGQEVPQQQYAQQAPQVQYQQPPQVQVPQVQYQQPPVQQAQPTQAPPQVQQPMVQPGLVVVTEEHKAKVQALINASIDRATAITAVAGQAGGGDAFRAALDAEIPF